MDPIAVILDGLRAVFGFLLLLFVPGFIISLLFFPRLTDLRLLERLVYSTVLSIGSVIVLVLFMDVFLGINTRPLNIFLVLGVFSVLMLIIWICEIWYLQSKVKARLDLMLSFDIRTFMNYIRRVQESVAFHLMRKQ